MKKIAVLLFFLLLSTTAFAAIQVRNDRWLCESFHQWVGQDHFRKVKGIIR